MQRSKPQRPTNKETILSASFFWQNDKPGGLGFTFAGPSFSPAELSVLFTGSDIKDYLRNSDKSLGTALVCEYLQQLASISKLKQQNLEVPLPLVLLASFNIIWLSERGFIPQDEFNGYQFIVKQSPT